jgi:hypothetical protein
MFSKLHDRLGTAGLVVAIVALVAALGGTALAAAGLNNRQKKEVTNIAKKSAKPGPQGPMGPVGPAGGPGAKGDTGAPGKDGTSPGGTNFTGSKTVGAVTCTEGGIEYKGSSTSLVCNGKKGEQGEPGEDGSPWTAGGVLPTGATETGTYSISSESGTGPFAGYAAGNISFTIPLPSDRNAAHVVYVAETAPAECENTEHAGTASKENPEADPGYLCVYKTSSANMNGTELEIFNPVTGSNGASRVGAILFQEPTAASALGTGTWAVTGP